MEDDVFEKNIKKLEEYYKEDAKTVNMFLPEFRDRLKELEEKRLNNYSFFLFDDMKRINPLDYVMIAITFAFLLFCGFNIADEDTLMSFILEFFVIVFGGFISVSLRLIKTKKVKIINYIVVSLVCNLLMINITNIFNHPLVVDATLRVKMYLMCSFFMIIASIILTIIYILKDELKEKVLVRYIPCLLFMIGIFMLFIFEKVFI